MYGRIPDRFGALVLVVDCSRGLRGDAWGDGVDVLPVGERVAVPPKVRRQIGGSLRHARADDEPQPGLIQRFEVRGGEHPGVGDHDEVVQPVPGLETLNDRQDRRSLGLVAFPAADLQREPVTVDQQPDDDLWVDPAFLGVADLTQPVFVLGLEVQRRDVVQAQTDVPAGGRVGEARGGDLVPVATSASPAQRAFHRRVARRRPAQVPQNPPGIQQRCRLHDPGHDQVLEVHVAQVGKAQIGEHRGQRIEQHL